jgi:plastocyanin
VFTASRLGTDRRTPTRETMIAASFVEHVFKTNKEFEMNRQRIVSAVTRSAVLAALALASWPVLADEDDANNKRSQATASFGRGLNTAQAVNHAVLPRVIKINAGGVVDFAVAGFHDIIIFKPGFTLEQLVQAGGGQYPLTPPIFVIPADPAAPLPSAISFLADSIYYRGISPAGGPLATAVAGNPANGSNRTEPVAFLNPGTYLVICNVRPHLLDGMYAYVKVD